MLAITYWAVWHNRNKLLHEGKKGRIQEVMRFIIAYIKEIDVLHVSSVGSILSQEITWKAPKQHFVNVNFDASFNPQTKDDYVGFIVRDHERMVMGTGTYPLENAGDTTTAEAKAYL